MEFALSCCCGGGGRTTSARSAKGVRVGLPVLLLRRGISATAGGGGDGGGRGSKGRPKPETAPSKS